MTAAPEFNPDKDAPATKKDLEDMEARLTRLFEVGFRDMEARMTNAGLALAGDQE